MAERRFALIVATSEYDEHKGFPPLKAPLEDARAMAKVLADPAIGGFEVQQIIDAERSQVEDALYEFFCGDEREKDDLLLLYFSGHGQKFTRLNSRLYLAVKNSDEAALMKTAVSAATLDDYMKASPSRKQVLLLDCCYSGAFAQGYSQMGNPEVRLSDHFAKGRGKFILSASGAIEESYEYDRADKKLSVFTEVVVEGLQSGQADVDGDGEISFEDLCDYTEIEVPARMPGQNPQHQSKDVRNKLLIAHNPAAVSRLSDEIEVLLKSNDPAFRQVAMRKILELSLGEGKYTAAARARLEDLAQKQDPDWESIAAEKTKPDGMGVSGVLVATKIPNPSSKTPGGQDIYVLEGMEFVKIPKGEFLMGSMGISALAFPQESPILKMDLPYDYWMGRFTVTYDEYALFAGKAYKVPKGKAKHPAVNVSWNDAIRYVGWLNQTARDNLPTGYQFRLPSEAEWEKAARGPAGNDYPWGDEFDAKRCNSEEGRKGHTTPVGAYSPLGDSPYGCADMAGNVWEWTRSQYKPYPYDSTDGREDVQARGWWVTRGGGWDFHSDLNRCAYRERETPETTHDDLGFRVVLAPVSPPGLKVLAGIEQTNPEPEKEVFSFGGMEFVKIPSGDFVMGSAIENTLAYDEERPQILLNIPYDYWMGRYPVTNTEYALFTGKASEIPKGQEDHPVVYLSWNDAIKYVAWLNQVQQNSLPMGYQFMLPTEAEWEKAARGPDGNEWPWGNKFYRELCNSEEGQKGRTTPVGSYSPGGDSYYGCADMVGNVWEWTLSLYKSYPYNAVDGREAMHSGEARVVRGGSRLSDQTFARCAYRTGFLFESMDGNLGFRLAVCPISSHVLSENNGEKPIRIDHEVREENQPQPALLAKKPAEVKTPTPSKKTPGGIDVYLFGSMEFVKIPKGKFIMGSKKDNSLAFDDERPQFMLDIPYDYWMGRCPVTNAQYALFTGKSAEIPKGKGDHPVVNVSWHDAIKYVDWLNQMQKGSLPSGYQFNLPSEAEWEKAARGTDGREWPWGNEFDPARCNTSEGGKGDTTPVGAYSPLGDSPYGCVDMVGNVWDWTRSLDKPYPYAAADGREDLQSDERRVLRGGSWDFDRRYSRCALRRRSDPSDGWYDSGFRVSLCPASSFSVF